MQKGVEQKMSLHYFLVAEMWLWKSTFKNWREKIKYLWARLEVRSCQSFAKLTTWPVLISWTLSPRIKSMQCYGKNAEQIILCTALAIFTFQFQGKYHYSQWLWKQWEKQTRLEKDQAAYTLLLPSSHTCGSQGTASLA